MTAGRSVKAVTTEMLQLVWIAHHINRDNLAVLDLKRSRLKYAVRFDRDKAGQAIDEAIAQHSRHALGEDGSKRSVELHDVVDTDNRLERQRRAVPRFACCHL